MRRPFLALGMLLIAYSPAEAQSYVCTTTIKTVTSTEYRSDGSFITFTTTTSLTYCRPLTT